VLIESFIGLTITPRGDAAHYEGCGVVPPLLVGRNLLQKLRLSIATPQLL
jgi:hypothetical protein